MTDIFDYKSPFSILGRLVDILFLKAYMMSFLLKKNSVLKEYAEREIVIN